MLLEFFLSRKRKQQTYDTHDTLANFQVALGAILFGGFASSYALSLYFILFEQCKSLRIASLGRESLGWSWYVWPIAIFLEDFTYYWFHRISHRVRVFWACHIVHHSSESFNYSTALRNGWFSVLYKPIFWLWMPAFGFHPLMVITCLSINSVYQFFCHTKVGMTWSAWSTVFSNPYVHEIHHGKARQHLDKNFGGIFTLFDRIFGTFHPPCGEEVAYGVTHPPRTNHVVEVIFHEFRDIIHELHGSSDWKTRIQILVKPPDWKKPSL